MKCSCEDLAEARRSFSIKDCAGIFGVSRGTVCNWLKKCSLSKEIKSQSSFPEITCRQEEILNGSMLGDGFVDRRGKYNSRFNKVQCLRNLQYLTWLYEEMKPFSRNVVDQWTPVIKRSKNGIVLTDEKRPQKKFYTVSHPCFTRIRNLWYPNNKKSVPEDLKITPLTLAVWAADDGSVNHKKRDARLHTDGFSEKEVALLIDKMSGLGFRASMWRHYGNFDIGLCGKNYDLFVDINKEFFKLWPCMEYKVFAGGGSV